ncbi:hypothetical protein [Tenacibaculum agarivorans]|uniref:hypothetical protein n=1 Tax=Tenacibaculum agarivorans TaxID=1908389 RepID=UPI00094BA4C9|nr:hypothetical protein [Tenacibaculum agarivorans]
MNNKNYNNLKEFWFWLGPIIALFFILKKDPKQKEDLQKKMLQNSPSISKKEPCKCSSTSKQQSTIETNYIIVDEETLERSHDVGLSDLSDNILNSTNNKL